MKRRERWLVVIAFLICSGPFAADRICAAEKGDPFLHQLFEDYWQFRLKRDPERATYLGDHRYDDKLSDYGEKARKADLDKYRAFRARLHALNREQFNESDHLSAELFERTLTDFLEMSEFPEHLMPIRQQESVQITLGMLYTTQPLTTAQDTQRYATRLQSFTHQVDDLIKLMNEGIAKGIVRPKITIEQSLPQIEAMIKKDPTESVLYTPGKTLTAKAGGEAGQLLLQVRTGEAMDALTRLRDYLKNTYLPKCRDTVGYCYLPNGKAWYRRAAKSHTTTDLTPEQLHQTGLDELKRIHADMDRIRIEVGFKGDVPTFIEHLRNDPAQRNKDAAEILRRYAAILHTSDANLPKVFGVLPKIPYEIKEMEPFRAAAAPEAYYYNAPDDGSRPAYFYVNTYQPQTRPIYTMEPLAYHEAQPGHHLQLAIAQEKKGLPNFRRFESIDAFIEGWALYSEGLGAQLGGYRDPYSRFGRLTFDAWRSSRLVVDTGMHYMGWTRQQAIDFMKKNTGLSEQNIISEVDRYIAWPGQALAYKVGELEIRRLRDEAEKRLGPQFDLRAFHDHLLAEGSLPLEILRGRMHRWMESQAKSH